MPRQLAAILIFSLSVSLFAADTKPADTKPADPIVVELTVKGSLSEEPAATGLDGQGVGDNLRGLVEKLAKAKNDPDVKAVILKLKGVSSGLGKANELRVAIKDFRKSGKKIYALTDSAGNAEYMIAAAADEVVMPESGTLMIKGLAAEVTFYKAMFDKLGIQSDTLQVGDYKGTGEPYTRTKMSPEFREELSLILKDNYAMIGDGIAERLGIKVEDATPLIDGGPYTPAEAKAAGLISKIAYEDELEIEIAKALGVKSIKLETKYGKKVEKVDYSGFAGLMKMMSALSGEGVKKAESKADKIAIIVAAGQIMTGKSSSGSLVGEATLGSDTVIKHLRQVAKDKTVKAIVLRVDSPGGSALASDLIWREIGKVGKPVVASMSDVAASGGYYISMGCDKIYAEPGTLTGSIGVVSIKVAIGGLMEKIGLTTETVTVGKNGTIMSMYKPFSDAERLRFKTLMEETYKQFVGKAAKGRKMEFSKLESLAGGRVYTGRQAKALGLIDEIGTLDDAITAAKGLAGMSSSDKTELLILPESKSVLESLLGPLEGLDVIAPAFKLALPESVRPLLAKVNRFLNLVTTEPVVMALPYDLQIR